MTHTPKRDSHPTSAAEQLSLEERIAAAVEEQGEATVVARALSLMAGNYEGEEFLLIVGGEHAQGILDGAPPLYWPELWGARALLYVWDDTAAGAVITALGNPAWRVREMAARVVVARDLPARSELAALLVDETPRVRIAAARALGTIGTKDDIDAVRALLTDPLVEVRRGAQQALDALRSRAPKA